jgi:hypothetical protein
MVQMRIHPGRKALFQHFPCTGGAELFSVIQELYGKHCAALYHDDAARNCDEANTALQPGTSIDMVISHVNPLGPMPAHMELLTIYRDPVERALSQHAFACRQANLFGQPEPKIPARDAWPDPSIIGANYYLLWGCRLAGLDVKATDHVDATILGAGKAVVERGYTWIGITERFQQSLRLLAHVLAWPRLPASTPQDHVKSGRSKTPFLDPEFVAWARHVTAFDQILYRKAVERFDRVCAGDGFEAEHAA